MYRETFQFAPFSAKSSGTFQFVGIIGQISDIPGRHSFTVLPAGILTVIFDINDTKAMDNGSLKCLQLNDIGKV